MLRKCCQRQLIPLVFVALVLENELQFHGQAVRINSENDASISFENFVEFGPVTSELTGLICERQVRHGLKTGTFSRISPNILYRFLQSFHRMKSLFVQIMDL